MKKPIVNTQLLPATYCIGSDKYAGFAYYSSDKVAEFVFDCNLQGTATFSLRKDGVWRERSRTRIGGQVLKGCNGLLVIGQRVNETDRGF